MSPKRYLWLMICGGALIACQPTSSNPVSTGTLPPTLISPTALPPSVTPSQDVVLDLCDFGTNCFRASWSPDSAEIVVGLIGNNESNFGPFVIMKSDFSDRRPLLDIRERPSYSQASWSPKGDEIAFLSDVPSQEGLWTVNLADGTLTQVVKTSNNWFGTGVSWSPDAQEFLYVKRDEISIYSSASIVIASRDGQSERVIQMIFYPWVAAWSPDGQKIAYVSGYDDRDLYVMDVNGGGPLNLTHDQGLSKEDEIAWSPESDRLIYTAGDGLFVINADGTNKKVVRGIRNCCTSLAWSPDGQWILAGKRIDPPSSVHADSWFILVKFAVDF